MSTDTPTRTALLDAIELADGVSKLAARLKIRSQSISRWKARGRIPINRVPQVEAVVKIPRHILRPDRPDLFPPPPSDLAARSEEKAMSM